MFLCTQALLTHQLQTFVSNLTCFHLTRHGVEAVAHVRDAQDDGAADEATNEGESASEPAEGSDEAAPEEGAEKASS